MAACLRCAIACLVRRRACGCDPTRERDPTPSRRIRSKNEDHSSLNIGLSVCDLRTNRYRNAHYTLANHSGNDIRR